MPRDMTSEMTAAVNAARKRPVIIVRIDTAADPVLAWSGVGPLEFGGDTYSGVGNFGGVTSPKDTSRLEATGISYTLRGVPIDIIGNVAVDMRQNLPARMWWGFLDDAGALVPDPVLIHEGLVGVVSTTDGPGTVTVTVQAESLLASMKLPREVRATPEDQRTRVPGDRGFDYVAGLQDRVFPFGRA